MSAKASKGKTPGAVKRTTRQFDIGDGLHIVKFRSTKDVVILRDEPGRTFEHLPTMSIEEAEDTIHRTDGLQENDRDEVLSRLAEMKKRKRIEDWSIGREQLREMIDQFGDEKASEIVYHAVRYFDAANIGAPVPRMENAAEDEALRRLIREQYKTESEVAR